jgi:flagellar biogenesis protein FliO
MAPLLLQQAAASLDGGSLLLDLLRTLIALAAVCGLIWFSLRWLARRGLGVPGARSLRVVGRLALEPRKNLYLVRAGKRVLLIGTGEGSAPRLIAELDEAALETEPAAGPQEGSPHV